MDRLMSDGYGAHGAKDAGERTRVIAWPARPVSVAIAMLVATQPVVAASDPSVQHALMHERERVAEIASAGSSRAPLCDDRHRLQQARGDAAVVAGGR